MQTVAALVAADRTGELAAWFDPPVPESDRAVIESEEGWILGPVLSRAVGE
jgi:hypothetical protein